MCVGDLDLFLTRGGLSIAVVEVKLQHLALHTTCVYVDVDDVHVMACVAIASLQGLFEHSGNTGVL